MLAYAFVNRWLVFYAHDIGVFDCFCAAYLRG